MRESGWRYRAVYRIARGWEAVAYHCEYGRARGVGPTRDVALVALAVAAAWRQG